MLSGKGVMRTLPPRPPSEFSCSSCLFWDCFTRQDLNGVSNGQRFPCAHPHSSCRSPIPYWTTFPFPIGKPRDQSPENAQRMFRPDSASPRRVHRQGETERHAVFPIIHPPHGLVKLRLSGFVPTQNLSLIPGGDLPDPLTKGPLGGS